MDLRGHVIEVGCNSYHRQVFIGLLVAVLSHYLVCERKSTANCGDGSAFARLAH